MWLVFWNRFRSWNLVYLQWLGMMKLPYKRLSTCTIKSVLLHQNRRSNLKKKMICWKCLRRMKRSNLWTNSMTSWSKVIIAFSKNNLPCLTLESREEKNIPITQCKTVHFIQNLALHIMTPRQTGTTTAYKNQVNIWIAAIWVLGRNCTKNTN